MVLLTDLGIHVGNAIKALIKVIFNSTYSIPSFLSYNNIRWESSSSLFYLFKKFLSFQLYHSNREMADESGCFIMKPVLVANQILEHKKVHLFVVFITFPTYNVFFRKFILYSYESSHEWSCPSWKGARKSISLLIISSPFFLFILISNITSS